MDGRRATMYDLIILGGGPAGLTATGYSLRKRVIGDTGLARRSTAELARIARKVTLVAPTHGELESPMGRRVLAAPNVDVLKMPSAEVRSRASTRIRPRASRFTSGATISDCGSRSISTKKASASSS